MAAVSGDVAADVAFAIAAILVDDDRGGKRIGEQGKAGIADATGKTENEIGRDGVLEINLAAGFGAGGILALQDGLLGIIVGDDVTQGIVSGGEAQAVV